jgi:hypothetical protein
MGDRRRAAAASRRDRVKQGSKKPLAVGTRINHKPKPKGSKVFWFFFSNKNCFLPSNRIRASLSFA